MTFLGVCRKFTVLQNSPAARSSPLARPGLYPSYNRSHGHQGLGAASERYIDLAEIGRTQARTLYSRSSESSADAVEEWQAKRIRSSLALPF